jgi:hypothetical protein
MRCKCLGCIALGLVDQSPNQFNGLPVNRLAEALIDSADRSGYSLFNTKLYYLEHRLATRLAEKGPQLSFNDYFRSQRKAG